MFRGKRPLPGKGIALHVEPLESRFAPSATFVNGTTATFSDVDGDLATVKISKPLFTPGNVNTVLLFDAGGNQLQEVDLTALGAASQVGSLSLSVTARRAAGGNGFVNVGWVNGGDPNGGTGIDLGAVTVRGDLGRITAGDGTTATPGLQALTVQSLGRLGTATQAPGGSLESDIQGALGRLTVRGDVDGAVVNVTGGADGRIGSVRVGGSLLGATGDGTGQIHSTGDMGPVVIGGDLQGGAGQDSGEVFAEGNLAAVMVGGSLRGGVGPASGSLFGGDVAGALTVAGDLLGGTGDQSGSIAAGLVAKLTVGGSLSGGLGTASGTIFIDGATGPIRVRGDVRGGAGSGSGGVFATDNLAAVSVGGSLIAGANDLAGALVSQGILGKVTIGGSLVGTSSHRALIAAGDQRATPPTGTTDVAIAGVTVGGRVAFADIIAGWLPAGGPFSGGPVSADAQIGNVTVDGDWVASNLAAGAGAGADGMYGTADDAKLGGGARDQGAITSQIGRVSIGGQVFGDPAANTAHFGFVAEQVKSFAVGGTAVPLTAGVNNDHLVSVDEVGAVTVNEVA
jgi:hypothetical protein